MPNTSLLEYLKKSKCKCQGNRLSGCYAYCGIIEAGVVERPVSRSQREGDGWKPPTLSTRGFPIARLSVPLAASNL